jgi:Family of unknown function (DUF6326)
MTKLAVTDRLSTLWLLVVLNMILADVLTAYIVFTDKSVLQIPGDAKLVMAIAAVVINLPIAMIYLSKTLAYTPNRIANVMIAIPTIVFVVGGGSLLPHYLIIATIEVLLLLTIIVIALRWQQG